MKYLKYRFRILIIYFVILILLIFIYHRFTLQLCLEYSNNVCDMNYFKELYRIKARLFFYIFYETLLFNNFKWEMNIFTLFLNFINIAILKPFSLICIPIMIVPYYFSNFYIDITSPIFLYYFNN